MVVWNDKPGSKKQTIPSFIVKGFESFTLKTFDNLKN
jgi:hypothetical protein